MSLFTATYTLPFTGEKTTEHGLTAIGVARLKSYVEESGGSILISPASAEVCELSLELAIEEALDGLPPYVRNWCHTAACDYCAHASEGDILSFINRVAHDYKRLAVACN